MTDYQDTLAQLLDYAKQCGADSAEASVNHDTGFSLEVREGDVDAFEHHQGQGVELVVYCGQRSAQVGGSDIRPESLRALAQKAVTIAKLSEPDPCSGLADPSIMAKSAKDLSLYFPEGLSLQQAKAYLLTAESELLKADSRISQCESASFESAESYHVAANSLGVMLSSQHSYYHMSISAIAKDEQGAMQRDSDYTQARDSADLDQAPALAQRVAEFTCSRLGARKIPTTQCPVLFDFSIAKTLINHFMRAISGRALYRDASFLKRGLGKQVFPEHVAIYQRPFLAKAMGSACFDSDLVATQDLDFVRDGVVTAYLLSQYSARQLHMQPNGTANGAHNLIVDMPTQPFASLLAEMGTGLYITELMGQGVNIVNGDYSRGASGFWVENGVIQFPVQEITIATNLADLFQKIVLMSDRVDTRGNYRVGDLLVETMAVAGC